MKRTERVYEAERLLIVRGFAQRLATEEDCQEWLAAACIDPLIAEHYPAVFRRPPTLKRTNHEIAFYEPSARRICLPPWFSNTYHLTHELSHCCAGRERADHGPRFVEAELMLVRRFLGREAGKTLRHALIAMGIL